MNGHLRNAAAGLALVALTAGCSSRNSISDGPTTLSVARSALGQVLAWRKAAPAGAPADPQAMAAEAMRVNPGPLILVGLEQAGTTQVLAMTGDNPQAGTRTFMTKNEQSVILRGMMVRGTRGLGHDLSVVEADQSAALVAAGQSGTARRIMRYYSGDGLERRLDFTCQIGPGPKAGVMVEACRGHGLSFQNNYLRSGGVSRQWLGPGLGYATIQVLRN